MQQKMKVDFKVGQGDQFIEMQPGTAIEIPPDDESSSDEDKSSKSTSRAIFLVLLFNVFLIVAAIPVYLYFRTANELLKQRVLDFLIVGGAFIGIPVLYCMGDLSEGRPNFYYI
ncbi:uncharacterized protein [Drosophila kikkawai]|uniref:Transmembrane protein n=1 Tax=Drosophila kikkawai TaxID=30033 RepID=A0A6P4JIY5_DROKI|nr:uncharacterized protein LOC108084081 [Drosophila kikkawai]